MIAGVFVGILFLGILIEWLIERFFGGWLKGKKMYFIAAAFGILLCCLLQVQILTATGLFPEDVLTSSVGVWTDRVLTGIIVGSGSSFIHKVIGWLEAAKNRS